MKTNRFLLCCGCVLGLAACSPVEPSTSAHAVEEEPAAVQEAAPAPLPAQLRSIVSERLLSPDVLKEFVSLPEEMRISTLFQASPHAATHSANRTAHIQRVLHHTKTTLKNLRRDMILSLHEASSSQEAARVLQASAQKYQAAFEALAQEENKTSWEETPVSTTGYISPRELQTKTEQFLANIEQAYGPTCAQKLTPVVHKTVDDYRLILASSQKQDVIAQALQQTGQEADLALHKTLKQYADPMLSLSEQDISNVRARAIEAHQRIEKQFEKLYGKQAVLQTRPLFDPYLNGLEHLLHTPQRLSEKQQALEKLGDTYRQAMTAFQTRLNEEAEATNP